jgi:hypothetical protein
MAMYCCANAIPQMFASGQTSTLREAACQISESVEAPASFAQSYFFP